MKFLMIFFLSLLACPFISEVAEESSVPVNDDIAIFTAEEAENLYLQPFFTATITGYWTPTTAQIKSLETDLPAFLKENFELFRNFPVLEDYQRQYAGLIIGGQEVIYANFACGEWEDLHEEWIMVLDGGDCFFQFMYDPAQNLFYNLMVNGEA